MAESAASGAGGGECLSKQGGEIKESSRSLALRGNPTRSRNGYSHIRIDRSLGRISCSPVRVPRIAGASFSVDRPVLVAATGWMMEAEITDSLMRSALTRVRLRKRGSGGLWL